jgi:hypothetical protein
MKGSPPYSVVVAADRVDKPLPVLEGLDLLAPAERPKEVFLSVGRNPSQQRNLGVASCRSPLVYFLDDDSVVAAGTVRELSSHFQDPRTAVAGGPNLVPPDAIPFERTVNSVLASRLGSAGVRFRYAAIGSVKEATEKDLILCNMMVRRDLFLGEGGFRKDLYPNEENEFLNRLLHQGRRLVYDPRGAVYRSRRKSLGAFCYQAFRYGKGRARQMKVYPCLSDAVHLIPALFLGYLLALGASLIYAAWLLLQLQDLEGLRPTPLILGLWAPFALFALLACGTGVSAASWHRRLGDLYKVPILILLRHSLYGAGLVAGFLSPPLRPEVGEIRVFKVAGRGKKRRFLPIKVRT